MRISPYGLGGGAGRPVTGDAPPGPSPVGLLLRHVLEERARALFPPGSRVLDVPREAAEQGALFDGAYAALGALDGVDLNDETEVAQARQTIIDEAVEEATGANPGIE